jgi:hypothetical protein
VNDTELWSFAAVILGKTKALGAKPAQCHLVYLSPHTCHTNIYIYIYTYICKEMKIVRKIDR